MRLAYLVSRYPAITHAFIAAEVRALRAAGVEIETASIRRTAGAEVLSRADEREFAATYAVLPAGPLRVARDHRHAFVRAPGAYLRTLLLALRASAGGARALLWQAFYFAEAIMLWAWLEERGLRHVHVHFANVSSDVALLATHFGNRLGGDRFGWSLTVHGPTELRDVATHKLPFKVRHADLVVCTSDFVRSQLIDVTPARDWPTLRTIYCGVDTATFASAAARDDGRRDVEILTVAALSVRKGHVFLVSALAELRRRGVDARLTLVGDGPERAAIEEQVRRLDLGDRVELVGALGHDLVAAHYRRADVFCLPSFAEGVPTVVMEAMASGLPVVATHVMGVPELVDRASGLLVPPARSDLLADALERLARDGELRGRMGTAARRRIESRHEMTEAVAKLRAALAQLPALSAR